MGRPVIAASPREDRSTPLEPGVWAVMPTPFTGSSQDLDERSLIRMTEFYGACEVTGITVLGVFGEAASLTVEERRRILSSVIEASDLPLVVGIASLSTRPAIEEIQQAQAVAGERLRAVMVHVNSAQPDRVIAHLQEISIATGAPIVLQNYPVASGVSIALDDLIDVVRACPFVCAVKAEAPPTAMAIARIAEETTVSIFGGLGGQSLLDELAAGAAGAMTGFSFPEVLVACVGAWLAGDEDGAWQALTPYLPLINYEQQPRIALALRKDLLTRRGLLTERTVRPPAAGFPTQLTTVADGHIARAERLGRDN
ncbi:dihydrodipicolinate synthase family protein [Aeromicrobium piscarium]|uniref:Dihydrodipicolinate synthase family protein n=1 Tax=Aeromicrobium piscarium TaxID=2590901 RepID=A0A554SG05_9ACTN|nr:dihydrodipicolinate synthase family protein [Aeromicrobium piscarium]TSD65278.1 dihydrodipicolinate synthase family protein [Aeromicrobium piscarium]